MKKLFALALTLTMVLSLAACGTKEETPDAASSVSAASSAAAASAEEAGITTVTPGKLTVATSPDFAPLRVLCHRRKRRSPSGWL